VHAQRAAAPVAIGHLQAVVAPAGALEDDDVRLRRVARDEHAVLCRQPAGGRLPALVVEELEIVTQVELAPVRVGDDDRVDAAG